MSLHNTHNTIPEHRLVRPSRRHMLYALCATFFVLLTWAAFADLEEVIMGEGQVVPSQRIQHIQHLEGGIVQEICVREGQDVQEGDILLRIDNVAADSVYRDNQAKEADTLASIARLEAELGGASWGWSLGRYPEAVQDNAPLVARHDQILQARRELTENTRRRLHSELDMQMLAEQELLARQKNLRESLRITQEQRDMAKKLLRTRSFSEMEYLNLEQKLTQIQGDMQVLEQSIPKTQASIRVAQAQLESFDAERRTQLLHEINEAETRLVGITEALKAHKDTVTRTEIRSPVHGTVKSVNITTTGGVVMPGQTIMDVVPRDDSLIIEAHIRPQDRAFLYEGQKARIRLSAYDFSIYGAMDARLEHIGADTMEGKNGEVYYLVRLVTDTSSMQYKERTLPILPGMMATADIITGKRTVLQYLLKPIIKASRTALREP